MDAIVDSVEVASENYQNLKNFHESAHQIGHTVNLVVNQEVSQLYDQYVSRVVEAQ